MLTPACTAGEPDGDVQLDGGKLELVWTNDTGAPINQPPLRVGDYVIVVPEKGAVLAIILDDGELAWEFDPPRRVWDRAFTSNGQIIFVGIEGGGLVALDAKTGDVRWEKDLGIEVQAPPMVSGGVIYVPTTFVGPGLEGDPSGRAKLYALDTRDGDILWEYESDGYILQTPFKYGGVIYSGGSYYDPTIDVDEGGPMKIYALDTLDGSPRWVYQAEDGFVKAIYASQEAVTYIGYQDFINGLDAQSGELRWRIDTGNWVPSLSGSGDMVNFGSANTVVYALDMDSGETMWEFNIPEGSFNYMLGAPVRVLDDLYFLSQRGDIHALNALDGSSLWSLSTGITARVGLSVSGPWLLIGDQDGRVYAYKG